MTHLTLMRQIKQCKLATLWLKVKFFFWFSNKYKTLGRIPMRICFNANPDLDLDRNQHGNWDPVHNTGSKHPERRFTYTWQKEVKILCFHTLLTQIWRVGRCGGRGGGLGAAQGAHSSLLTQPVHQPYVRIRISVIRGFGSGFSLKS